MKPTNKKPTIVSFWKNEKKASANTKYNKVSTSKQVRNNISFIEPVKTKLNNFQGKVNFLGVQKNKISFISSPQKTNSKSNSNNSSVFTPRMISAKMQVTKTNKNFIPKQVEFFPLKKQSPEPESMLQLKHQPQEFFHTPKDKENKIYHKIPKKEMNWIDAKASNPKLSPWGDADYDGVINMLDCKPFNKFKQDDINLGPKRNNLSEADWRKIKSKAEQSIRDLGMDPQTMDFEAMRDNTLTAEEMNRIIDENVRTQFGLPFDNYGKGVTTTRGLIGRGEVTRGDLAIIKADEITSKTEKEKIVREARKELKSMGLNPDSIDFNAYVNEGFSPIENRAILRELIDKKATGISTTTFGSIPSPPTPGMPNPPYVEEYLKNNLGLTPWADNTKPPQEMPNNFMRGEPQPTLPEAQENVEQARYLAGEYGGVELGPQEPTLSEAELRKEEKYFTTPLSKNQIDKVVTDVKRYVRDEYKGVLNPEDINWYEATKEAKTLAEVDDAAMKAVDNYLIDLEKKAKEIRRTKSRPEGLAALPDVTGKYPIIQKRDEKDFTEEELREAFKQEKEEAYKLEKKKPGRPQKAVLTPEDLERTFVNLEGLRDKLRNKGESEFAVPSVDSLKTVSLNQLDKERTKIIGQKAALESELKYIKKLQMNIGKTEGTIDRIAEKSMDIASLNSTIDNYTQAMRLAKTQTRPIRMRGPGRPKQQIIKEPTIGLKVSPFGGIEFTGRKVSPGWILNQALLTPAELEQVKRKTKTPEERGYGILDAELKKLSDYKTINIQKYRDRIEENENIIRNAQGIFTSEKERIQKELLANPSKRRELSDELNNLQMDIDKAVSSAKNKIALAKDAEDKLASATVRFPTDVRTYEGTVPKISSREINRMEKAEIQRMNQEERSKERLAREQKKGMKEYVQKFEKWQETDKWENKLEPAFRDENLRRLKPVKIKFTDYTPIVPGAEARAEQRQLAMSVPEYAKITSMSQLDMGGKMNYAKEKKLRELSAKQLIQESPEWTFKDTVKETLKKLKPRRNKEGIIEMPPVTLDRDYEKELGKERKRTREVVETAVSGFAGPSAEAILKDIPAFEERESKRETKERERAEKVAASGEMYTAREIAEENKYAEDLVEDLKREERESKKAEKEQMEALGETTSEAVADIPEPTDYSTSESSMGTEAILDELSKEDNKYDTSKEEKS